MPKQGPQRIYRVPIWGILLLFLGIVFLLQNLDVLPWGLWGNLWHFWPVLIIIIGLNILLSRYNPWLVGAVAFALLCACLGIAIWQYASPTTGAATKSYSEPLGSFEHARIEVDFAAGSLRISSLPSGSPNFVEANSKASNGDASISADFHQQDNEGRLYLSTKRVNRRFWDEAGIRWEVRLTRNIPLTIDVRSAASNMNLDLSQLEVIELRLDIDAGNCSLIMPSSAGVTRAYIDVDAANLDVTIPDEVAAKIRADVNLAGFDVDASRFTKKGEYYISQDFEGAQNRVELEIDCNIGKVQVK